MPDEILKFESKLNLLIRAKVEGLEDVEEWKFLRIQRLLS